MYNTCRYQNKFLISRKKSADTDCWWITGVDWKVQEPGTCTYFYSFKCAIECEWFCWFWKQWLMISEFCLDRWLLYV